VTTTLRPAGPERREAGGGRTRDYTVCVNGRPVGSVRIGAAPDRGPGRIEALAVDEQDRRRGRGTVAALAAEEVLRQWGCTSVLVSVPDEAGYALRMAAALGYTETGRVLHKDLAPGALGRELPACVVLRDLTEEEAGSGAPAPAGLALDHDGTTVGRLWLRTAPGPGWVHAVEVLPAHRGRGYGRALMLAAESACIAVGTTAVRLNLPPANAQATRLCTTLGYRALHHDLTKPLA
jgi:GNAT superfamily N-acetyltransferase